MFLSKFGPWSTTPRSVLPMYWVFVRHFLQTWWHFLPWCVDSGSANEIEGIGLPCLAFPWIKESDLFCHPCRSLFWISRCSSRHDTLTIMASLKNNTATELSTEPGSVKRASAPDIPQHVLIEVFRYLPLDDLLNVSLVCKSWNAAANTDDVWKGQCQQCWASKVYVRLDSEGTWKKRFEASSRDGRRIEIKRAELCTFNWRFRWVPHPRGSMRILEESVGLQKC